MPALLPSPRGAAPSSDETVSGSPVPLRRRNGRLQACDPCRRRKVACDHTQPVCRRCSDRNQDDDCTYTASASRLAARLQYPRTANAGSDPPLDHPGPLPAPAPASATAPAPAPAPVPAPALSDQHPRSPSVRAAATTTASSIDRPGYLGFTSYSTVYEETRNCLSTLQGFQPWLSDAHAGGHNAQPWDPSELLTSPTREMWLVVLRSLPTPVVSNISLTGTPLFNECWARVAARRILGSLRDQFGAYLGPPCSRSDAELQKVARFLTKNTVKPFRENVADPDEWIGQFLGPNLRWESLGLLYTFSEMGQLDDESAGSDEWIQVSRVCLGLCIDLARRFSYGSSLILMLCLRRTVFESMIAGDAGLCCWRYHAESVAMLTFLGLHAETEDASYQPSLSSENRRRLVARTFSREKVLVTFTGRPPLISRRYTSTPLPLDLSDDVLLAGGPVLTRAVRSLDAKGWNTSGDVYPVTLLRARTMSAFIRDELLEIALGSPGHRSVESLLDIRERQMRAKAEFPSSLTYDARDLTDSSIHVSTLYARLLVQLEHLQNLFVAERLLLRRGRPDEGDLLVVSFEMVSLTLTFWTHKDRLADVRRDFEWLLMAYGAPGGGILCMELLHPSFSGLHPMCSRISRASIVQQLSLLMGFLDWVPASAPNADLCANCKLIIQHVLDHSLNAATGSSWPPQALDSMQFDFNFELLDTFGWMRPGVQASD